MTTDAKLFPIANIVHALTGVVVGHDRAIPVDLYKHLEGADQNARDPIPDFLALRSALKSQLPQTLASFSLRDLALLVVEIKQFVQQEDFQGALVMQLEKQFGKTIAVCPNDKFGLESDSLRMLRALAEEPERRDLATGSSTSGDNCASKPANIEKSSNSSS